ncbi:MAG: peptide ABC transporter substrate-binding protein [Parachlamydiales bacterium]|nr:peptide ABC transporter substrate-binding protein [Parachlamydiales bacterium]
MRLRYSFIIVLIFLLNSCSNNSTHNSVDALKLNITQEPITLDPRAVSDLSSANVVKMLFEGLCRRQPDGAIIPALADEIISKNNGLTYCIHLRECYWTNGDRITSNDVIYSWSSVLSPDFVSPQAAMLYAIKNGEKVKKKELPESSLAIRFIDEYTLEVDLEQAYPYFSDLLAFPTFFPVSKKIAQSNNQWWHDQATICCSGPFKISDWKHDVSILIKKNPFYWDADIVKMPEVQLIMVSNNITEFSLFESGDIDWTGAPFHQFSQEIVPILKEKKLLKEQPILGVEWYQFNTEKLPFNNVHMRQAFALAINRQEIVENLFSHHHVATGLVPKGLYTSSMNFIKDNQVEIAQALFQQGLKELKLTKDQLPPITLSFNSNENHRRIAQAIQQQWKNAFGISVNLESCEWQVYLNKIDQHDFQISRLGWVAYGIRNPITFLKVFQFKGGNNSTQWENPVYKDLINSYLEDTSHNEHQLLNAEHLLIDEAVVAPIFFHTFQYAQNPRLKEVYLSDLGDIDLRWSYFELN